MPMLHTVNKSPFERNTLDSCLRLAKKGSTILLIEDGVYAALEGTRVSDRIRQAMQEFRICVLEPDLEARGVADRVIEGIERVDYGGFVDLVAEHDAFQAWL
ncbi:sulfurtransferase complex subunit TusB [Inmirania thermothiophila]|uniref:tRNA 2-thiouridine synthesizing protein B n=1 Tax=Inmirania thermothiophila TaxID=1750597 RepID=A0A3N1Y004_9GAMM|nr:sulfurtransferase complex subunit TusB [Inmirania thermothiophila]ROR32173.1 tRNA 2-thiouridine synthesizing protein B [Inmirania thermothiophila]